MEIGLTNLDNLLISFHSFDLPIPKVRKFVF